MAYHKGPRLRDQHGTRACYEDGGCRCQPCRDAVAAHERAKRARRIARGGPARAAKARAADVSDVREGPYLEWLRSVGRA